MLRDIVGAGMPLSIVEPLPPPRPRPRTLPARMRGVRRVSRWFVVPPSPVTAAASDSRVLRPIPSDVAPSRSCNPHPHESSSLPAGHRCPPSQGFCLWQDPPPPPSIYNTAHNNTTTQQHNNTTTQQRARKSYPTHVHAATTPYCIDDTPDLDEELLCLDPAATHR